MGRYTKWVSTWGTATSISDRREAVYAKDLTIRYPIRLCFDGSKIRVRFSNLTGTEDVKIDKAFADNVQLKQRIDTMLGRLKILS